MQQYPVELYATSSVATQVESYSILPLGGSNYMVGSFTLAVPAAGVIESSGAVHIDNGSAVISGGQLGVGYNGVALGVPTDSGYIVVSTTNVAYVNSNSWQSSGYDPWSGAVSSNQEYGDFYSRGAIIVSSGAIYDEQHGSVLVTSTYSKTAAVYSGYQDDTLVRISSGAVFIQAVDSQLSISSCGPTIISTYDTYDYGDTSAGGRPVIIALYPAMVSGQFYTPVRSSVIYGGVDITDSAQLTFTDSAIYISAFDIETGDATNISAPYLVSGGTYISGGDVQEYVSGGYIAGSAYSGYSSYIVNLSIWSGASVGMTRSAASAVHASATLKTAINSGGVLLYSEDSLVQDTLIITSSSIPLSGPTTTQTTATTLETSTTVNMSVDDPTIVLTATSIHLSDGVIVSSGAYIVDSDALISSCSSLTSQSHARVVYSGGSAVANPTEEDYPLGPAYITAPIVASGGYLAGNNAELVTSRVYVELPNYTEVYCSGGEVISGSTLLAMVSGNFIAEAPEIELYANSSGALLCSQLSGGLVEVLGSTLVWSGGSAVCSGANIKVSGGDCIGDTPQQVPWFFSRAVMLSGGVYTITCPSAVNLLEGAQQTPIYACSFDEEVEIGDSAYPISGYPVVATVSGGELRNTVPALVTYYTVARDSLYTGQISAITPPNSVAAISSTEYDANVISGDNLAWYGLSGGAYLANSGSPLTISGAFYTSDLVTSITYSDGQARLYAMGLGIPTLVETSTYVMDGDYIFSGDLLSGASVGPSEVLFCSSGGTVIDLLVGSGGYVSILPGGAISGARIDNSNPSIFVSAGGVLYDVYCTTSNPFVCYVSGLVSGVTVAPGGVLQTTSIGYGETVDVVEQGGVVQNEWYADFFGHQVLFSRGVGITIDPNQFYIDYSTGSAFSTAADSSWNRQLYIDGNYVYELPVASDAYFDYHDYNSNHLVIPATQEYPVLTCSVTANVSPVLDTPMVLSDMGQLSLHSITTLVGAIIPPVAMSGSYNYGGTLLHADNVDPYAYIYLDQSSINLGLNGMVVHTSDTLKVLGGVYKELAAKAHNLYIYSGCMVTPVDYTSLGFGLIANEGAVVRVSSGGCVAGIVEYTPCDLEWEDDAAIAFTPTSAYRSGSDIYIDNATGDQDAFNHVKLFDYQDWGADNIVLSAPSNIMANYDFTWVGGNFNSLTITSRYISESGGFVNDLTFSRYDRTNMWGKYLSSYIEDNITAPLQVQSGAVTTIFSSLEVFSSALDTVNTIAQSAYTKTNDVYYAVSSTLSGFSAAGDLLSGGMLGIADAAGIFEACTATPGDGVLSPYDTITSLIHGDDLFEIAVPGYYTSSNNVLSGAGVIYSSGYCYNRSSGITEIIKSAEAEVYATVVSAGVLVQSALADVNKVSAFDPYTSSAISEIRSSIYPLAAINVSACLDVCSNGSRMADRLDVLFCSAIPYVPKASATASGGYISIQSGANVYFDTHSTYIPSTVAPWTDYYVSRLVLDGGSMVVPVIDSQRRYPDEDMRGALPTVHIKELFVLSGGSADFVCVQTTANDYNQPGLVESFYVASGCVLSYGNPVTLRDTPAKMELLCLESGASVYWGAYTDYSISGGVLSDGELVATSTTIRGSDYTPLCIPDGVTLDVAYTGVMANIGVLPGGALNVGYGGEIYNCAVNGGSLIVKSNGHVGTCTVYSSGTVTIEPGGVIDNIIDLS